MTTALILGALAGQVDAVKALHEQGITVHVCARDADGPGAVMADAFHQTDITDVSAVRELAERISADFVYSVGSDIAMPTVAAVSESLGLPHFHDSTLTATLRSKQALRRIMNESGICPVEHVALEPSATPNWTRFPCMVKPIDAQGQRGITIVREESALPEAVKEARRHSDTVIIEDLLEGPEISAHLLVEDGEVIFYLPSDRHVWDGPLVGIPQAHSLPLRPETAPYADELLAMMKSLVAELRVQQGPLYAQAICTSDGVRIIEVASRLDGCHLWRLIEYSTGVNIMDALLGRLNGRAWPDLTITEVRPATLAFFLDDPSVDVTPDEYLRRHAHPEAVFTELQLGEDNRPRRTNDVVARLGYQIHPGI